MMRPIDSKWIVAGDRAGWSMLEAVVSLAITVVLMSALGTFVLFQNRRLSAETRTVIAEQDLRAVLDLISGDLREAGRGQPGLNYSESASPPGICLGETTRVRMTADLDGDGATSGPGEDVSYCLCAGSGPRPLLRAYRPVGAPGFVVERIVDSVSQLQLGYAPRSVSVLLAVTLPTALGPMSQAAQTRTFLRNVATAVSCAPGPACPPPECPI